MSENTSTHSRRSNRPVVIVTGSSGLIGGAIIEALREKYQVVGFDRDGQPQPPPEIECVCVDLTDEASVTRGLQRVRFAYGEQIAAVIHLAAYYDFSGEPSDLYDKVTVEGTRRLLQSLLRERFSVERFIFSSTMLVHAPTEPGVPINEDSPIEARWGYPESKVETEAIVSKHSADIPALILRIAGVYTDRCDSIPIAHQIQRIYERRLTGHVFPGDIEHGQSFVHLDDLVAAIESAVERRTELAADEVLLIGEPKTIGYYRIQRELARLIHGDDEWNTRTIPKAVARSGAWIKNQIPGVEEPFIKPWMVDLADDHYELDVSRAQQRLGWNPRHRLLDTLPKMIENLQRDPEGWFEHHDLPAPDESETETAAAIGRSRKNIQVEV